MAINRINNTGKVQNQLPDHSTTYDNLKNNISDLNSFIVVARVTDIVLNDRHEFFSQVGEYNGIGAIFYEIVNNSGTNTDNNGSVNFALPHDSQLKVYPLINEYVVLINIPDNKTGKLSSSTSYFYLSPVNIWNHPHHDAYPNPSPQLPYSKIKDDYTSLEVVSGSVRRTSTDNEYLPDSELNSKRNPSQNTFIEKADIHPLLPFMGDALLEGRHGQSLRFGSTAKPPSPVPILEIDNNWSSVGKNGDPITILRNGQLPEKNLPKNISGSGWIPIVENISQDLTSIYLTSYQKIPFSIANENFVSYTTPPTTPSQFTKPQIILNSDRIVLNAKTDSILISGQNSVGISSNNSVNIESTSEIGIASKLVKLGSVNASQAVLRGDETIAYLKALIIEIENIASALKTVQNWPGGVATPNPVLLNVATCALETLETVYNEIDSVKSKTVKTV